MEEGALTDKKRVLRPLPLRQRILLLLICGITFWRMNFRQWHSADNTHLLFPLIYVLALDTILGNYHSPSLRFIEIAESRAELVSVHYFRAFHNGLGMHKCFQSRADREVIALQAGFCHRTNDHTTSYLDNFPFISPNNSTIFILSS